MADCIEHEYTPWRITNAALLDDADQYVVDSNENIIVSIFTYGPVTSEHARRIVACVNACAGLSTELLEKAGADFVPTLEACMDISVFEEG